MDKEYLIKAVRRTIRQNKMHKDSDYISAEHLAMEIIETASLYLLNGMNLEISKDHRGGVFKDK